MIGRGAASDAQLPGFARDTVLDPCLRACVTPIPRGVGCTRQGRLLQGSCRDPAQPVGVNRPVGVNVRRRCANSDQHRSASGCARSASGTSRARLRDPLLTGSRLAARVRVHECCLSCGGVTELHDTAARWSAGAARVLPRLSQDRVMMSTLRYNNILDTAFRSRGAAWMTRTATETYGDLW